MSIILRFNAQRSWQIHNGNNVMQVDIDIDKFNAHKHKYVIKFTPITVSASNDGYFVTPEYSGPRVILTESVLVGHKTFVNPKISHVQLSESKLRDMFNSGAIKLRD